MHDFMTMVVKALVDQPDEVSVNRVEGDRCVIFEVRVAPDDVGKVIGTGGRNAAAIRRLACAVGTRAERKRIWVDINETGATPVILPEE